MDERMEDGGIEAALGAAFLRLMEAAQRDHRLSTDIALICQKLAEEGVRSIPGTCWLVGLLDTPHSDSLRVVASAGEGVARLRDTVWSLSGTLAAEAMSGGRSQSAPASVERLGMGAPLPAGVQFALALPLYPHDHGSGKRDFHGCLLVLTEEGGFRDVECRLADAFANIINLAVTRAEVRLRLREAASRLETGVEVAVDLAASLNPLDVIHRLVQRAVQAVDADRAGVYQVDADDLVVEGSHDASGDTAVEGVRASLFEQPLFVESRTTRQAVRGGPLNIEALPETLQAPHRGVRHSLVLPLL
ncbi:MAG TPA: hypothetical protein VE219_06945, partial [Candidatus Sulfotelmatobacter sp.]|nr:hypothetical protein [Candidatus Sulfotelmatobacter sp.]